MPSPSGSRARATAGLQLRLVRICVVSARSALLQKARNYNRLNQRMLNTTSYIKNQLGLGFGFGQNENAKLKLKTRNQTTVSLQK